MHKKKKKKKKHLNPFTVIHTLKVNPTLDNYLSMDYRSNVKFKTLNLL